jgi:hypothetical protein
MSDTTNPAKKQKTDETTTAAPMALSQSAPNNSLANTDGRTSETPVSIPPTITYGLQDTHTTIIPSIFWLSAINLANSVPLQISLRLNSFNDIIESLTGTIIAQDDAFATPSWCNKRAHDNTITTGSYANLLSFPNAITTANEQRVWYRNYFAKLYQYYTVLGCEYEIVINNPRAGGRHAICAYSIQTEGVSNANRLPVTTELEDMYGMKEIQYKNLQCRDNSMQQQYQIIRGTYKPGTAKRDVSNDGDVKLWTQTASTATPTYKELLQMHFYQHPLSHDNTTTNATGWHLNIQFRMKYIVQYKQQASQIAFPLSTATPVLAPSIPTDVNPY